MLQIRLSKQSGEGGGGAKPPSADTVTVACPEHLVIADLPVAKSLGTISSASVLKTVGRRSRRQLGERVHFCVRCDFPVAVYGRLSPCDHAFCLDCARSDSLCYLCDERIQKIQTLKMMEGIFICAAPHCFKSFLKTSELKSHIHEFHADLLNPNIDTDGKDLDSVSARKPTASDSTVQAPPPRSSSQFQDHEAHRHQTREQMQPMPIYQPKLAPPFAGQIQNHPMVQQPDNSAPPGFDRPGGFPQQILDSQGGQRQETGQFLEKSPFSDYPMHPHHPPNYAVTINSNPVVAPPQFGYPPFAPDGSQAFYGNPYDTPRPDSTPDVRSEKGSLLGFPPGPAGATNFAEAYPRPWNMGQAVGSFEPSPGSQGTADGFANMSDPKGSTLFQGDYGQNLSAMPPNLTQSGNKGMEARQSVYAADPRDGKGILAPQPLSLPSPPPFPPIQMSQLPRGWSHSGEGSHG